MYHIFRKHIGSTYCECLPVYESTEWVLGWQLKFIQFKFKYIWALLRHLNQLNHINGLSSTVYHFKTNSVNFYPPTTDKECFCMSPSCLLFANLPSNLISHAYAFYVTFAISAMLPYKFDPSTNYTPALHTGQFFSRIITFPIKSTCFANIQLAFTCGHWVLMRTAQCPLVHLCYDSFKSVLSAGRQASDKASGGGVWRWPLQRPLWWSLSFHGNSGPECDWIWGRLNANTRNVFVSAHKLLGHFGIHYNCP